MKGGARLDMHVGVHGIGGVLYSMSARDLCITTTVSQLMGKRHPEEMLPNSHKSVSTGITSLVGA